MKLKLPKDNMFLLEDILLDAYYDLGTEGLEGNSSLREIIDTIQIKLYGQSCATVEDE